jgi:hypothetical protein
MGWFSSKKPDPKVKGWENDGARIDLRFVARAEAFVKAWRGES